MKNKFLLVALIGLVLSAGIVLVSCGGCPGDGDCTYNTTTYTMSYCGLDALDSGDSDDIKAAAQCAEDIVAGKDCSC